jgi:hypothetical protein
VAKNDQHLEFFGGNLTGVHTVRFVEDDRDRLFSEVLEADDRTLEERLHSLKTVNPEWKVSSDVFNISSAWLIHAFCTSKHLDEEQRFEGMVRVCQYLQYKFLTSRLFQLFRYPADKEVAAATYAQLTYKFALKVHGSWGKCLRARAEAVCGPESIWRQQIEQFDEDYGVTLMLNDVQGRIRDMLKNIYGVFLKVHEEGGRIKSTSATIESDGEVILKDRSKSLGHYTRYIRSVIPDRNSFIRQELLDVICDVMDTMPPRLLTTTLEWASLNYAHLHDNHVEAAVDLVMEHAFDYFAEHREFLRSAGDLPGMLSKLRGAYMSSRSTDQRLFALRSLVEGIVREATNVRNDSLIAATRTGFMLYVVLRAFTMKHYAH